MILVAARHLRGTRGQTRFARIDGLSEPQGLLTLNSGTLLRAEWTDVSGIAAVADDRVVPLYTCAVAAPFATFHVVAHYERTVSRLVRGWTAVLPDIAPGSPELLAWMRTCHDRDAALNIGPPRLGMRLAADAAHAEVETKFTVAGSVDPVGVAVSLLDSLAGADRLHHRVLRSLIHTPDPGGAGYAAFTERPDGRFWAKAKLPGETADGAPAAGAGDAVVRQEHHAVVDSLDAGREWARAVLRWPVRPLGRMTRECWDLVTEPDPEGDMCVVTVDHSTLGSAASLTQVEIEYAARLAREAATARQARSHVDAIADRVGAILAHLGVTASRDDRGKVEHFRAAGAVQ